MKNAGLYVRVSTEEQATSGHSIAAQTDRLTKYCEALGYNIYNVYVDDGVSGGVPLKKRAAGSTLSDDIKKRKIDTVVAYSLSRLFRDVVDGLSNIKAWDKKDISVVLLDVGGSSVDTSSAMGKMLISVMLACTELERTLTGERVSLVHQHKKANRQVYSKAMYGFDRVGDELVPNEEEQNVVQQMKSYRSDGYSYRKIATTLNAANIPTKEQKQWYPKTVSYIINNNLFAAQLVQIWFKL